MTIVEFLTARLDELESGVRQALKTEDYGVSQFDLDDIAMKRRMVERAWLSVQYIPPADRTPANNAAGIHAFWVLAELASVYSDHPDYSEEWKP